MNVLDSQLVTSQLRGLGYRFIDTWEDADVILYNTCSVREQAENKVWSRVGKVGKVKKQRPEMVLGVIGCMAERDGQDMIRKHPQIDLLCGPGELDKLPMLIDNVVKTNLEHRGGVKSAKKNNTIALQGNTSRRSSTLEAAGDDLEMLDLTRSFAADDNLSAGKSAYVRITRGCNKFCTYCVVPHTRGREIHRPPQAILDECRQLVEAGVIEITLLGQTINHYHYDTAHAVTINGVQQPQIGRAVKNLGNGSEDDQRPWDSESTTSFADLLAQIHDQLPELKRLRFVTSFPRDFGDDILDVMASRPRICKYFHLPVQSGSNAVLKTMNRGYEVEEYFGLVDRIRAKMPDAELATDIICGFCGETDQDHEDTKKLLEYCQYKSAFIFKYSPRPGTIAYDKLPDDVPTEVKRQRNNELLAIQSDISLKRHQAYVGRTVEVFVESISQKTQKENRRYADSNVEIGWDKPQVMETTQMAGRTDGDMIVVFDGDESMIGSMVEVRIDSAAALTLMGTLA